MPRGCSLLGGPPPRAKQTAGAWDSRECAGHSFSLCDYPNNIRVNGHRKEGYPMLIPYASYGQVTMRSRWGHDEVSMEIRGAQGASHWHICITKVTCAAEPQYILSKKTEKHTIYSACKTIFAQKCSACNTLSSQKCCVYKTFFVILQRISLFNQQSEQL